MYDISKPKYRLAHARKSIGLSGGFVEANLIVDANIESRGNPEDPCGTSIDANITLAASPLL